MNLKPVSDQSTPLRLTSKGNSSPRTSFGGALHTILTVESNYALTILLPNLQCGTTPYSGIYLNHAPITATGVPPIINPEWGCMSLTTQSL